MTSRNLTISDCPNHRHYPAELNTTRRVAINEPSVIPLTGVDPANNLML
jgi:hypothetical protein